jgi:hypothetical protein
MIGPTHLPYPSLTPHFQTGETVFFLLDAAFAMAIEGEGLISSLCGTIVP